MLNVVGRDVYLGFLAVFIAILLIIIRLLNPPAEEAKAEPPGNLIVHIVWPQGPYDVDMWVDGPDEPRPVGYSNKAGVLWNLLRDDLGTQLDPTDVNFENAYTRGVIAGEYTINVHAYRVDKVPLDVRVEVSISAGQPGSRAQLRVLVTTKVTLTRQGEEKTAIRFTLTKEGKIVDGSMHRVFRQLRSATK